MSFNPVLFMYLNPDLQLGSVEQAAAFRAAPSNAPLLAGRWSNLDALPRSFDAEVFLTDSKDTVDVSGINASIQQALLLEGQTPQDLTRNARYLPTVYRTVHWRGPDTFQFNRPGDLNPYLITGCNLRVGDSVRIVKDGTGSGGPQYATVTSVAADSNTFTVSREAGGAFADSNASYLLTGVRLYDPQRLARVAYLARYAASNQAPTDASSTVDPAFNVELYQMLYPDARLLDREQAYVDWVSRRDNADPRIARTVDLGASAGNASNADRVAALTVTNLLNLDVAASGGRLAFGGVDLYYASKDDRRRAADIPPFFDGLITERAIKTYVERPFQSNMALCNLTVRGDATFCNAATASNLRVRGDATFDHDVTVRGSVRMQGLTLSNLSVRQLAVSETFNVDTLQRLTVCNATIDALDVTGRLGLDAPLYVADTITAGTALYSGRIGIADAQALPDAAAAATPPSSNAVLDNLHLNETLSVGGAVEVGTPQSQSQAQPSTLLRVHGIVEADNLSSTSDARLKTNVRTLDAASLLEAVRRLRPVSFEYKHARPEQRGRPRLGFVAQELQEVIPEAVIATAGYAVPVSPPRQARALPDDPGRLRLPGHGLAEGARVVLREEEGAGPTAVTVAVTVGAVLDADHVAVVGPALAPSRAYALEQVLYDDVRVVDHQQLLAALVGCVQELSARVAELQAGQARMCASSRPRRL